jgi:hypothetical protein
VADFDLTTLDGLLGAVAAYDQELLRKQPATLESGSPRLAAMADFGPRSGDELGEFTGTYCAQCGGLRRMRLVAHDDRCAHLNPRHLEQTRRTLEQIDPDRDPLPFTIGIPAPVFTGECLQCQRRVSLIVDAGPPSEVIVLGVKAPGLSTAHTPDGVAFYLDQAYRARISGAHTAATAMYRAALEQFLSDQGFASGTLAARIDAAIGADGPWVRQLDEELMHALRALGNQAIHHGPGDLSQQLAVDRRIMEDAELLFIDLLDEVYEEPARRDERRQRLLKARHEHGTDGPAG